MSASRTNTDSLLSDQGKLAAALAQIDAETADEVAEKLRQLGRRGRMKEGSDCPVANHVKAVLGCPRVQVTAHCVYTWNEKGKLLADVELSRGIREFIQRHDDGGYPYLVEVATAA